MSPGAVLAALAWLRRRWLAPWALLFLCLALSGCIEPEGALVIRQAGYESLAPGASRVPQQVSLPHDWDYQTPPISGRAVYTFSLPRSQWHGADPVLYFPKVGNTLAIEVNGVRVFSNLESSPKDQRSFKQSRPYLIALGTIPPGDPVQVRVEIEGGSLAIAGMSHVFVGDRTELQGPYAIKNFLHTEATWMIGVACLSMGLLALLVWTRVRDSLYLYFGVAALLWAWRTSSIGQSQMWMPTAVWSYLFFASYGWFVALIGLYVAKVSQFRSPWWQRMMWAYFALSTVLFMVVVGLKWHFLRVAFNAASVAVTAALLGNLVRETWRERSQERVLVMAAGILTLIAGVRDLWSVQSAEMRFTEHPWARFAVLSFMLVMAWLLVDRLVKLQRETAQMNQDLEAKVRQREAELAKLFEQQRSLAMAQAATTERERIVRDMHDGIGGQLMTVLRGVERGAFSQDRIAEVLQESLDDLRLIIDASSAHSELVPALAAWRHRWDPRLEALGIELVWVLDDAISELRASPEQVLQTLRLMQEAVINAVKHAQTPRVTVKAWREGQVLALEISDEGQGFDPARWGETERQGRHGLRSMTARAQAIGATLDIRSAPGQGSCVTLRWAALP
jgi:signal transduction histidine kinase